MFRNHDTIARAGLFFSLLFGCAVLAPGCGESEDKSAGTPPFTDAGEEGGGADGSSTGGRGSGGAGSGGKAGGSGGAEKDAGIADSGMPSTESGSGGTDGGSTSPPLTGTLFVAGSSFTDGVGQIVAIDLATGNRLGRTDIADGDLTVNVSSGRAFALERSGGAVDLLTSTGAIDKHIVIDTGDGGSSYPNPHDVLVAGPSKAYVPLNAGNAIAVIDLTLGTQTGLIPLAALLDPTDGDGSTEPDAVLYDDATHRAYFVLGRTNVFSGSLASKYIPMCPPVPSLVVAVDTTTDTLVDTNGDAGGIGIALPEVAPGAVARGAAGKAFIVADGCNESTDGGALRAHHGIASLDVSIRASVALYTPTAQDFLGSLLATGQSTFLLETQDDNYVSSFHAWSPSTPSSLGRALANVPGGPVVAQAGTLVGRGQVTTADGSTEAVVIRYEVATETATTLAPIGFTRDFGVVAMTVLR